MEHKFSFQQLVKRTQMKEHRVRFRVQKMNLGQRVTDRFFLYSDSDVRLVREYNRAK